ncbi:cytochrome P450 [Nocardia sp. NPDC052566]|uniref:cytochrome P450 n=1 Tax=Nocardia sp. NPDC052566 TaxID=3364330 RepID=UPI0037C87AC1
MTESGPGGGSLCNHGGPEEWRLPVVRDDPFALPDAYRKMAAAGPIHRATVPNGKQVWVVTRHSEGRKLLTDARITADRAHPNFPSFDQDSSPALISGDDPFLVSMDPPQHTRSRNELKKEFEQRRIREFAPRVQSIVDEAITELMAGPQPADLVAGLALRVPSRVICELLGVPYADHTYFESRTPALIDTTIAPDERIAAFTEVHGYLTELVAKQEAAPTDDIIGRYIGAARERGDYRRETLISHAFLLLIAGHETTANQIALSVLALLLKPELRERFMRAQGELAGPVDELLRFFTIVDSVFRVATADIDIAGARIRAGDGIVVACSIANRDPGVFATADDLDLAQGDKRHLAFGFGAHQCLGQGLARLEVELVLRSVLARLPGLALAVPAAELRYKGATSAFGVEWMPVTW